MSKKIKKDICIAALFILFTSCVISILIVGSDIPVSIYNALLLKTLVQIIVVCINMVALWHIMIWVDRIKYGYKSLELSKSLHKDYLRQLENVRRDIQEYAEKLHTDENRRRFLQNADDCIKLAEYTAKYIGNSGAPKNTGFSLCGIRFMVHTTAVSLNEIASGITNLTEAHGMFTVVNGGFTDLKQPIISVTIDVFYKYHRMEDAAYDPHTFIGYVQLTASDHRVLKNTDNNYVVAPCVSTCIKSVFQ
jgi:hypothetical protein